MKRLAMKKNKTNAAKISQSILVSLLLFLNIHLAYAQSTQGGIIPNGENTFLDQNGKPLSSGKVYFYTGATGSTVPKTTYSDINLTNPNTNPVVLDAAGRALLWGTGNYRQQVFDKNNNLIWDQLTSAAGSGSGGGGTIATGDGDLVGTIKPWAGPVAPNQYMFAYGAQLNRTTYSALFTAITSTQAVFCSSSSPILSGLGDTNSFWIGMTVEISCVPSGVSTVISKTSNTVTLAANANVTINTTATFFMWGNGDGITTFTLPDFRGIVPMGNNIMGGVASSKISISAFGSQNPNSAGANGGNQTVTLLTANLPPYTPAGTNSSSSTANNDIVLSPGGVTSSNAAGGSNGQLAGSSGTTNSITVGAQTFTGTPQGGISTAFSIIPPSLTVNYIIKVTPDANSATASGVTSLGGMTGSVACGSGLLCTGNNISVTANPLSVGGSVITGGTNTKVLYDNSGILGEYASIPVSVGGTGGTSASGILLDNITAFSSTGFLTRTGTGTYAFQSTTNGITNANLAQANATTIKANPTGSLANEQDITLGSTLNFSGTTLNCTAASSTQVGCVEPDNVTITVVGGKIVASGGSATTITLGSTTIGGSPNNHALLTTGAAVLGDTSAGTVGQYVASNGSSADPSMVSGPWTLLTTLSPSTASSIGDTTHVTSSYNEYEIVWENITFSTTGLTFEFQVHSGGSFQSTSYLTFGSCNGGAVTDSPTTYIPLAHAANAGNGPSAGRLYVSTPSTSVLHMFSGLGSYITTGPAFGQCVLGGYWNSAAAIDGFQFILPSGTFSGTIKIYGRL